MTVAALDTIRGSLSSVADAVRWACVLEATSPKPGNVHPTASFSDLKYADFVVAAEITALEIAGPDMTAEAGFGDRLLQTIVRTTERTGTNVNLGIALLINPLVMAVESCQWKGQAISQAELARQLSSQLRGIDGKNSVLAYKAIGLAMAGGIAIGESDEAGSEMDAQSELACHDDFLEGMRRAAHRDQIAWEYANDFRGILGDVVPSLRDHLSASGDWLTAIQRTSVQLLSEQPDSLISRKNGQPVAENVMAMARKLDPTEPASVAILDKYLRSPTHRMNPGTTADKIAAGLFVLLVCDAD